MTGLGQKTHLLRSSGAQRAACGLKHPKHATTRPPRVTCLNCIKSPAMADIEVLSSLKRGLLRHLNRESRKGKQ